MKLAALLSVAVTAAAALAVGDAGGRAQPSTLDPGAHRIELTSGGRSRSYVLYVPPGDASKKQLPLVVNFHGGGSNAEQQAEFSQMNGLARRKGFAVVYPNGTGVFPDRLLTWNAGRCCGYAQQHDVDDVAFARAVIRDVSRRLRIDGRRVYATGMSNGAMMAYRLAAETKGTIAAIAPVAGGAVTDATPLRPLPVLHFHSVDDPRAPYGGGLGPQYPGTGYRAEHPNIEAVVERWARSAGCEGEPSVGATRSRAADTATRITYSGCRAGVRVMLWKLTGAGHVWPGGKQDVRVSVLGPPTRIVDANAEMWRFFARQRLPA
jgi:polyhydroxybutyrate depolymerase